MLRIPSIFVFPLFFFLSLEENLMRGTALEGSCITGRHINKLRRRTLLVNLRHGLTQKFRMTAGEAR